MSSESRRVWIYLAIVLASMLACAAVLPILALNNGPFTGDLTRVSRGLEREFGWRREAMVTVETHFSVVSLEALQAGDPPGDIVVFGDSFSIPGPFGVSWMNTLHAATGLQITFVNLRDFRDPMTYLRSRAYRENPPKLVLVETVERDLVAGAAKLRPSPSDCEMPPDPLWLSQASSVDLVTRSRTRRTRFFSFEEVMSTGVLVARGLVYGTRDTARSIVLPLNSSTLFSNPNADELLIFKSDILNHLPSRVGDDGQVSRHLVCALRSLAGAGNGRVFLLVAPDKRTIYEPYVTDPVAEKALDLFALARAALGPAYIDLKRPLSLAVAFGVKDVYWPNDTHWSDRGHRIAGEAVANHLLGNTR